MKMSTREEYERTFRAARILVRNNSGRGDAAVLAAVAIDKDRFVPSPPSELRPLQVGGAATGGEAACGRWRGTRPTDRAFWRAMLPLAMRPGPGLPRQFVVDGTKVRERMRAAIGDVAAYVDAMRLRAALRAAERGRTSTRATETAPGGVSRVLAVLEIAESAPHVRVEFYRTGACRPESSCWILGGPERRP